MVIYFCKALRVIKDYHYNDALKYIKEELDDVSPKLFFWVATSLLTELRHSDITEPTNLTKEDIGTLLLHKKFLYGSKVYLCISKKIAYYSKQ